MNMFIRWMVRPSKNGVDFGIWKTITPADLYIPLDVHTGNVGRKLGLLKRKQNDWQAVEELTQSLRNFDPNCLWQLLITTYVKFNLERYDEESF